MPTDNARVIELAQAIGDVIQEAQKEGSSLSMSNSSREKLVGYAEKLAIAAREPEENLYFQATQVCLSSESKLLVRCISHCFPSSRQPRMLPLGPLLTWAFSKTYLPLAIVSVQQTSPQHFKYTRTFSVSQGQSVK